MSPPLSPLVSFLAQEIQRRYVPNLPFKQEKLYELKDGLIATDADLVKALGHLAQDEWHPERSGHSLDAMLETGATAQTLTSEQREIFRGFQALRERGQLESLGVENTPRLIAGLMDVAEGRLGGDLKRYIGKLAKAAEKTAPEPKGLMFDVISICTLSLLGPWGTAWMLAGGASKPVPTKEAAEIALRMKEAAKALKRD